MGSCCSCRDGLPDNHPTKFKVTNVDDEGTELGSGVMELTQTELVLYTRKRDAVRWPYLCLRRYGYDSNLFSFESGRRCQTGQGIFAFKCSRAEEIFNLLQELMQRNSISVVEEPVIITRTGHPGEMDLLRTPQAPGGLGYTGFPNGFHSFPHDGPNYPSARHPSMGNVRHPSVGEDAGRGLITPEDQSHTYVNTASGGEEELGGRHCVHSLPEAHAPYHDPPRHRLGPSCSMEERNPQVYLQPGEVKFVLGPAPAYRRMPMRGDSFCQHHRDCQGHICSVEREPLPLHNNNNECKDQWRTQKCAYENINGLIPPGSIALRRGGTNRGLKLSADGVPFSSCSHRRTAMLHYENLPPLPPVWECQSLHQDEEEDDDEEEDSADAMTPSLNGYHDDPVQNYMNAESTTACGGYHHHHRPDCQPRRSCPSNVFNFDFRRPHTEQRQLNYIQVELEGKNEGKARPIPQITCTPAPNRQVRRADSYAVIDLKKTAAMSSLQRALPRDDGTSRKTRHNSTDLPL